MATELTLTWKIGHAYVIVSFCNKPSLVTADVAVLRFFYLVSRFVALNKIFRGKSKRHKSVCLSVCTSCPLRVIIRE